MHQPRTKLLSEWIANPPTVLKEICLDSEAESKSPIRDYLIFLSAKRGIIAAF